MNQTPIAYAVARVMPEAVATGLLVSICTIQAPTGAVSDSGQPTGAYSDVVGLVDIRCMDAVMNLDPIQATEAKAVAEIAAKSFRHIFLDGYYPLIIANVGSAWRAVVDGTVYDLLGAEPDSQSTQTRLSLQLVTV